MGILLNRLLIILNDSDSASTDYHIARTLIQNFYELHLLSIGEVAGLCSVSKSTISKFIRNLGFEDYADFRASSVFEENKYGFALNYNQNIAEYIDKNGLEDYINCIENDIRDFRTFYDIGAIRELAHDLIVYKKVAAFGLLFSEIGAMDLQMKLAYNGKFILSILNDIKQDHYIRSSDENTLIIIYSNSGGYIERYQLSEFQEAKNYADIRAKIVLITSNKEMRRHPAVDLCICHRHLSSIQSHSVLFPLINDAIIMEYRKLTGIHK